MSFLTPGLARSGIIATRKESAMSTDVDEDITEAEALQRTREERDRLQRELATIADCLLDEAQSRDWCSEYDSFCERVNRLLGREVLAPCTREHSAEFVVRLEWWSVGNIEDMTSAINRCLNNSLEWPSGTTDQSIGVTRS